ncbi:unnamed protein product [Closterium sp. NIES-53]
MRGWLLAAFIASGCVAPCSSFPSLWTKPSLAALTGCPTLPCCDACCAGCSAFAELLQQYVQTLLREARDVNVLGHVEGSQLSSLLGAVVAARVYERTRGLRLLGAKGRESLSNYITLALSGPARTVSRCPTASRTACPPPRTSRPAAAHASRSSAPRLTPCCSLHVAPCCPARHALLQPARRALLQPARRALLQPARRALLPCTLRPAAASASHPTAASASRSAALRVSPCCSQRVAIYCPAAASASRPTAASASRSAAPRVTPYCSHRHAATTGSAATRATAATGGGAALSFGSAIGAGGGGGATGSAVTACHGHYHGSYSASESAAALGASESATALGASESAAPLGARASRCFFRDCTTLTPLAAPVPVSLADPTRGLVVARASSALPCPAVPSSSLSGLHLPTFSTNLVSNAAIQDVWVDTFIPGGQRVAICTCSRSGRHFATISSGTTASVTADYRISAVCTPVSLSLAFSAHVGGTDQERYFLLVVDDYTRYNTLFPLRRKVEVGGVLIPWIRATRRQLRERFSRDFLFLRLHSNRSGEFSSDLLVEFCRDEGIVQSLTLPASPQQNGIDERRIGLIMEVARTSMIHADAPHILWPFAVRYAAHQLNLWPSFSELETSHTLRWIGKVGGALVFRVSGALSIVRDANASKLSSCTLHCVFLGFPTDIPPCPDGVQYNLGLVLVPIPTPCSYAEAIAGEYSSQWQTAMDAEMASWKSIGTYVDAVPPPGANIVDGMWIFKVMRPPGSPPAFKARYIARGFSQRQGVDFFHTFSPSPKMTTLRVLLHVAAQRDYELHSLDFSTAFLQGSLHEEIWLRCPPGFTGSFPAGTQWSLRQPVYGLRQAPREWHDKLRMTLAALRFAPSTADPSLFLRTDTSVPPFYVLVYVDDLVFATADTEALALVKSDLQKRHTCTDLGELRSYLGLQITRDRARRTITLTKSHIVHQVLQRFGFHFSSPQPTPLSTSHSLSAPPSNESVELSGQYPELVGCLMYVMTCTRPDLAYPPSILARYVALGRHQLEHWEAAKRVLRYLCSTSGMGLVLGGRGPVVLIGHAVASWVDDLATQWPSQGYTFSLGSGFVSWRSTRSSSVLSSSCEAEIYAGAMAAQESRWLTYLLTDLGERPRSSPHGQLRLAYVATRANTADIFTKALQSGESGDHQPCFSFLLFSPTLPMGSSPPPQPAAVDFGAETAGAEPGGAEIEGEGSGGADSGGAKTRGAGSWGAATRGADSGGSASPSGDGAVGDPTRGPGARQPPQPDLLKTLLPQAIRAWIVCRGNPGGGGYGPAGAGAASPRGTAGAGGTGGTAGAGGAASAGGTRGAAGAGGVGATSPRGATGAAGAGPTSPGGTAGAGGARGTAGARGAGAGGTGGAGGAGPGGARTGGVGAARAGGAVRAGGTTGAAGSGGTGGTAGARAAGAGGAGGTTGARGPRAAGAIGAAGAGGAGGAAGAIGAGVAGATGAGGARAASTALRIPFSYPQPQSSLPPPDSVLRQVLSLSSSTGLPLLLLRPSTDQSQPQLLLGSLLLAPAPHTEVGESLTERHEPETHASTPVRTRRIARPCPPVVLGTHGKALRPSSIPQRVVLSESPASSLPHVPDPESDLPHAASPTVTRLLANVVTIPDLESTTAFALVTELVDFAARSRLDYVASLFELGCLAAALPRFASMLLCPEGDPNALDIPTPRSYAEAIAGEYSSQWQTTMDAQMASWKSRGTYVNKGVDSFQTFSPTPKMTILRAPREWHNTLRTTLAAFGFAPSSADPSLFLRTDTTLPPFYVLVYVLQRFAFQFSSPQPTPLSTGHLLSAPPSDKSVDMSGPYPELVGCLMYVMTCTRPDLAYPLSLLARYVAPGRHRKVHWDAAKRVLRYLCSTSGMGLVLGGQGSVVLTRHSDASWADDQATQRSSQSYTFSLGSGSVSWRSSCSSSVLSFSSEAEIYARAMATQELGWLTYLLTDLGERPRSPPVLYVDNKAMLALCHEQRLEHRTKHIALRYFLARELQQRRQLRLSYVASRANTADVFTKALRSGDHQRFCTALGLVPTLPHLLVA